MNRRIPIACVLLVSLAAGTLAAVASHDVAVATGAVSVPVLGWLVPVIVEFAAVSAALLGYSRSAQGQGALAERVCLGALMALATTVNAAHCSSGDPLGIVLAAAPPIVLLTSVELLIRNAHRSEVVVQEGRRPIEAPITTPERIAVPVSDPQRAQEGHNAPITAPGHSEVAPTPPAPQIVAEEPAHLADPEPGSVSGGDPVQEGERKRRATPEHKVVPKASTPGKSSSKSERLAQIASWVQEGERVTGDLVAERLGVSPATGRRLLAEHRAREGQAA